MENFVLPMLDTSGIQSYIFNSNRLQEHRRVRAGLPRLAFVIF